MIVDGETFEGSVRRCEPFSFGQDAHEDDVSVVLFSSAGLNIDLSYFPSMDISGGGEYLAARLDLLYSASGGAQFEASSTSDIAGKWFLDTDTFEENPLPEAPVTIDGDRIKGGLPLIQSWPQDETGTVQVTFDLEIPSEIEGC